MKFTIPGRLPGLNEIIGANRSNRFAGARQKKDTGLLCQQYILVGRVPVFAGPVRVHFDWYVADVRDPDNIRAGAKFILDALVASGRIPNDNQKIIKALSDSFLVDKVAPRTEVTIVEA